MLLCCLVERLQSFSIPQCTGEPSSLIPTSNRSYGSFQCCQFNGYEVIFHLNFPTTHTFEHFFIFLLTTWFVLLWFFFKKLYKSFLLIVFLVTLQEICMLQKGPPNLMLPKTTSQSTLYHILFIFSIVITTIILLVVSSLPLSIKYMFQEDKLLFSSVPPLPMMVHNIGETFNNICSTNKE